MTTYGTLISAWLTNPTPATLAELHDAVRTAPNFSRDLLVEETTGPLAAAGAFPEVIAAVEEMMPGALLSPAAHAVLADAFERTGQPGAARREKRLARAAMRSILDSGDGSPDAPWSVLRVSDEYDVLRALHRTSVRQDLLRHGERLLDRHTCADGSEVHFDATVLVAGGPR